MTSIYSQECANGGNYTYTFTTDYDIAILLGTIKTGTRVVGYPLLSEGSVSYTPYCAVDGGETNDSRGLITVLFDVKSSDVVKHNNANTSGIHYNIYVFS